VTTSPALLAAERPGPVEARDLLAEIGRAVALPVHASVASVEPAAMYRDGRELAKLSDNIVVQIPLVDEAVVAIRRLTAEGVRVAATLVFSAAQALLAAKAGAAYISPFMGRLDDISEDGLSLIEHIVDIYANYPELGTNVLAASIRTPLHVWLVPALMLSSAFGYFCVRPCRIRGNCNVANSAEAEPMRSLPCSTPPSSAISATAASCSRNMPRALSSKCSPASVNITRRGVRVNSGKPSSSSSCRICIDIAACVTLTRFAPAVNVRASAMARNALSCLISILTIRIDY